MTHIPEHDLYLSPNLKAARCMLEWISPSPDDPNRPQPNERCDELPELRRSHTFVIKDDAVHDLKPRNDTSLSKTIVGTLDEWGRKLAETNIAYRCGIFVQVDGRDCIVADAIVRDTALRRGHGAVVAPAQSLPLQPSITVRFGSQEQWVWVLTDGDALSQQDRDAIARKLFSDHGSTSVAVRGKALVRVAGFYARQGEPVQVSAQGLQEYLGARSIHYTAGQLRAAFLGGQQEVTEEKVTMHTPVKTFQQAGIIDTAVTSAIVGEVKLPHGTAPYGEFGLFRGFPSPPSLAIVEAHKAHLVWLVDRALTADEYGLIGRKLRKLVGEVAPRGGKVSLPKDGKWVGSFEQGHAAGVHAAGDMLNSFS